MGTVKAGEHGVRVLQKNNTGSYSVSLPVEVIRQLKWQQGQKLTVQKRGKTLVIQDWKQSIVCI